MFTEGSSFPPSVDTMRRAFVSAEKYHDLYRRSVQDPARFWGQVAAETLVWDSPFQKLCEGSLAGADVRWFADGSLNASVNCVDRHQALSANKPAILFVGNEPGENRTLTYGELYRSVNVFASALKSRGVGKGDRVILYMPMIPEAAIAMLACARIGAIHSVVFGGFSAKALRDRIADSGARLVITANEAPRGAATVALKKTVDEALREGTETVERVVVFMRTSTGCPMVGGRDIFWQDFIQGASGECPHEVMGGEDPLFMLYTSGSTGKPKGLLHTTAGYLTYVAATFEWVFDYHPGDVFWCTADVGWITGHSYIVYGPLAKGATIVMYEGVPTYPTPARFWEIIDQHQVNIFYTAPTAIRALMKLGDEPLKDARLDSLRVLGSVGEPINPKAWLWYHEKIGKSRCPVVDTWWQTETGGIMISPLPGATTLVPGSATRPLFGIEPALIDPASGGRLPDEKSATGALVICQPWPGMARTIWGDHERYVATYFSQYPGYYCTGDGAERRDDGNYFISGRMDDVINVSGHRLGTFEIESALVSHPAVAESAVIGVPHEIKGQGIYAFVTLRDGQRYDEKLKKDLIAHVRQEIGPVATPERIHWAPGLPKTRSGKIMRRILRGVATGDLDHLGDTSTLADPGVIETLLQDRQ